ncbi:MAG: alpha-2-macroglobulin family protein [Ferruginibacter sp.]
MAVTKFYWVLFFTLFFSYKLSAQQHNDYSKDWKTVEQFEKKGLTKSALKEVMRIFDMATASGNQVQQVKSAMYQMKYRNLVEEDNKENNIFYVDTLISKTKAPARNILQSMQAELLLSYRQNNRYKFYNRTKLTEEKSRDITTWSLEKLNETISSVYKASLKNETALKNTPLNGLDAILEKGKNTRQLRPTLYDLLANRALNYFSSTENDITKPAYKFILDDEKIFAPAKAFVKAKFTTKDSTSLYNTALLLFQDVLQFHLNDQNPAALIEADLERLEFAYEFGIFPNKDKLYENALLVIETANSNNPAAAQTMYLRAQLYYSQGQKYDPHTHPENQYEIKRAKELCEVATSRFPASEGAINCQNLLAQIKVPLLNMESEIVNVPSQPFRSLVKYKNINVLYVRILKVTREQVKKFDEYEYDQGWKHILEMKPLKSWEINLPNQQDYQQHSTEIKIDALTPGIYMILSSIDREFALSQNILARQVIYVSNISYILNNKDEMYVLNRENGLPLLNAEVQLWQQTYNYNTRKYEDVKKEKYLSDRNGYIKLRKTKDAYNFKLQFKFENDELFMDQNVSTYYYNGFEKLMMQKTFLFTDRSIYRPGQTVYFKGIVVNSDSTGRKNLVVSGYRSQLGLYDANGQKVSALNVQSGEFGSYSGQFKLPEGSLNGQFYISDSVTKSTQFFNVEEYKRPKFFVEIKKPAGTYKINDTISVKGNAKAYAGNNIDGATVTYRVVRKIRYPIWWEWGYFRRGKIINPGSREEMEITNGETTTNANGEFTIVFRAIPDETVDKKSQPVFYYEVSADITDINGETRSGNNSVAVAYQMLQLEIISPGKIEADSIKNVQIKSTNLNDLFEPSSVNVTIFKLTTPGRIFRERYWEVPDQFTMSKEEYYSNFPHDAYSDENLVNKWPLETKVIDKTDSTRKDYHWSLVNGQLRTGYYKIIAVTKDKNGEEVKAEKFIQITDGSGYVSEKNSAIDVDYNTRSAEPGEKVIYQISTGFDQVWLIHSLNKNDGSTVTYQTISSANSFRNEVPVTEQQRGGMNMNYAFVKYNRAYIGSQFLNVPWSNKDLSISYETFRDKLLPGSEEKWKLKISGYKKEKVAAEALISMYDASLDQFKPHNWVSLKSLWPVFSDYMNWTKTGFSSVNSIEYNKIVFEGREQREKSFDELLSNGWNEGYGTYQWARLTARSTGVEGAVSDQLQEVVVANGYSTKMSPRPPNSVQALDSTKIPSPTSAIQNNNVQVRKNFNETAFFFPSLLTDADGNIEFSFTIPEALTTWKMLTLSHSKELSSGYSENTVVTQKPLMVQPNAPRFLREGDQIEFSAKIVNLSAGEITGTAQLELFDAATNKAMDGSFKNMIPAQYFTVASGQSSSVKFPLGIPHNFNSTLTWRIKAITKNKEFTDGEEAALPVLTNRMLVTESMPLNLRNQTNKKFTFDKLLRSDASGSLTHHALTVEYTSNPAWYAVQALPYLTEFPYECAEQNFNRYYANILAGYIANASPAIKAVFSKWNTSDTAALMSNLSKNQELKSVLLQETPWVLDAKDESQQKKNIALLFDMVRMSKEKNIAFDKLKEMQTSNGGFAWFKGGTDDRYITQYIISGIGHLRKLKALSTDDYSRLKTIVDKALPYLDARLKEEYDRLVNYKANLKNNNLSNIAIQYLYMRSFFEEKINNSAQTAYTYYRGQSQKFWLSQSKYMQAMISLSLYRSGDQKTAASIITSLKENAIYKEEMGMYWKELAGGGYYWYQSPIESQAMIIEAFTDIDNNGETIDDLKTWLLKQKQTQNWRTTKATAEACYALLLGGSNWLSEQKNVEITLGNTTVSSASDKTEAGTGYFKKTIEAGKINTAMGNISVSLLQSPDKPINPGTTSWGAVYWQYFEDLDKITSAATPLKLEKKLFIEKNSDRGPVLHALNDGDELHIGDKIRVRIELKADRDMEYIHMKDMRASCMEPINVISEYKYQDGLGYYESTKDASTNFFFGWLSRGTYVFEYPLFVTHAGHFSNGITSIQCMYAPEFTSHSNGINITVTAK